MRSGLKIDLKKLKNVTYILVFFVIIAILACAVLVNFISHNFDAETMKSIKIQAGIQKQDQLYTELLTAFQNQYSSFISSLTVILSIFTVILSILAIAIPFISINNIENKQHELEETLKQQQDNYNKMIKENNNKIQNQIEDKLNINKNKLNQQTLEWETMKENILEMSILSKQSLLATIALHKYKSIADFDYYYDYVEGSIKNKENPLLHQSKANEYYEEIKYTNPSEPENEEIDYDHLIDEGIKSYLKTIELHKKAILKQRERQSANSNDKFIYADGMEKEKAQVYNITNKLLDDIGYVDKSAFYQAYRNCAFLYHKSQYDRLLCNQKSKELLEEVLSINNYDFDARNSLGCLLCDEDEFEKAILNFNSNIEKIVPGEYDNSYTNMLLGITYWKQHYYTHTKNFYDLAYNTFASIKNQRNNIVVCNILLLFVQLMDLKDSTIMANIPSKYSKPITAKSFETLAKYLPILDVDFIRKIMQEK